MEQDSRTMSMDDIKLKKVLQGYSPADVDKLIGIFKDEIKKLRSLNREQADANSRLVEQNRELKEKLSKAGNGKVANTESLLQIVDSARTTADQIITSARTEAEELVMEAKLKLMDADETAKSVLSNSDSEAKSTLSRAREEAQSTLQRANSEAKETMQNATDEARNMLFTAKTKAKDLVDDAQVNAAAIRNKIDSEFSGVREIFAEIIDISRSAQGSLTNMFADVESKSGSVIACLQKVPNKQSNEIVVKIGRAHV